MTAPTLEELTAQTEDIAKVLRDHSYRILHESPTSTTIFGCWGCAWQGDSSSIPTHQAEELIKAGVLHGAIFGKVEHTYWGTRNAAGHVTQASDEGDARAYAGVTFFAEPVSSALIRTPWRQR